MYLYNTILHLSQNIFQSFLPLKFLKIFYMFRRLYVQTLYVRYFYTFRFIRLDVIRSDVMRSVFIRSDVIRSDVIRSVIIRSVGESLWRDAHLFILLKLDVPVTITSTWTRLWYVSLLPLFPCRFLFPSVPILK